MSEEGSRERSRARGVNVVIELKMNWQVRLHIGTHVNKFNVFKSCTESVGGISDVFTIWKIGR